LAAAPAVAAAAVELSDSGDSIPQAVMSRPPYRPPARSPYRPPPRPPF
jgi:hypothetical protein